MSVRQRLARARDDRTKLRKELTSQFLRRGIDQATTELGELEYTIR